MLHSTVKSTQDQHWYCTVWLGYFSCCYASVWLWFSIDILYCSPQIERRLELVRAVSHNTHKRLVTCLQGQVGTDAEKRPERVHLLLKVPGTPCVITTMLELHEFLFLCLAEKAPTDSVVTGHARWREPIRRGVSYWVNVKCFIFL